MDLPFTSASAARQDALRGLLQAAAPNALERLAAAALGRLIAVPFAVAQASFQAGGDGGTAGRQGRRLRIECKRYGDGTALDERSLLGEFDQAVARDEALEAWVLVATRAAPEQLEMSLQKRGGESGVPILIVDWKPHGPAALAALCAFAPDLVDEIISAEAGAIAGELAGPTRPALEALRRDLESWSLGFESLRAESHRRVSAIWDEPRSSNAYFGQDAAGGAEPKRVRRLAPFAATEAWWRDGAQDAPLAVLGWDGVGKTWAALDWMVQNRADLPIVLVVASAAAADLRAGEDGALSFLAGQLHRLTGVRDAAHWVRRVERLLKRPVEEGPAFMIFFDGLNQEPSVRWLDHFKVLQGPLFGGRVRVILSTRHHHFDGRLGKLRSLVVAPVVSPVGVYDDVELDQMLDFEGLVRAQLHPDLLELARTPRLFKLVVRFREALVEAGQVTLHRLLWEYGRDSLGARAGRSFTEAEWREWLQVVAAQHRDGVRQFTLQALAGTTARADLTETEVAARLSDIIDGRFATAGPSGVLTLTPAVVDHALGAALVFDLGEDADAGLEGIEAALNAWLDPIAGFDQRAEILRAAVSILLEQGDMTETPIATALVGAWLQTQNLPDAHRREVIALAPSLVRPLLDTIERPTFGVQTSAHVWAVRGVRAAVAKAGGPRTLVVDRIAGWFARVSCGSEFARTNPDHQARVLERLISRAGVSEAGVHQILGQAISFQDQDDEELMLAGVEVLDGGPLADAAPVFEVAATCLALTGDHLAWDRLKWVVLLNELDPDATADTFRRAAREMAERRSEAGVHPQLGQRVAAILLWLSGLEGDEEAANALDPGIDSYRSYETYLADPVRSFLTLERRHAAIALLENSISLRARLQRTADLWLDPTFDPPAEVVAEVRTAAAAIDVTQLNRVGMHTQEDGVLEDLELALARCAPDLLADRARRSVRALADRPADSRYWAALRAAEAFVIFDGSEVGPARSLRLSGVEARPTEEAYAATQLLYLELPALSAMDQRVLLIECDLSMMLVKLKHVLKVPSAKDHDALVQRFGIGSTKQRHDLLLLLSMWPTAFSETTWAWVEAIAADPNHDDRSVAFQCLARADEARFGRCLQAWGWSWEPQTTYWINHYGSGGLIAGATATPFDQLVHRIAPWRVLEAARRRGAAPGEVDLAVAVFGAILAAERVDPVDPGSLLTIDRREGQGDPLAYAVKPRPDSEGEDAFDAIRRATDPEAQRRLYRRAAETARARIEAARQAGANLYLANIAAEDLSMVLDHAPTEVDRWLEGMAEASVDFRRRVSLAELAYLALCEALLHREPPRGAALWRALRRTLTTRFVGEADVEDMLHILFQAPASAAVAELRLEQLSLRNCHSDAMLQDLALAATLAGQAAWLTERIAEDAASPLAWRRRRATVLSGFQAYSVLPVPDAWPERETKSGLSDLRRLAARSRALEASAHHWWRQYLSAEDADSAYAAWILFVQAADRRAHAWISADVASLNGSDEWLKTKLDHVELNRGDLKRAMTKRSQKLEQTFLGRRTVEDVGPWRSGDPDPFPALHGTRSSGE